MSMTTNNTKRFKTASNANDASNASKQNSASNVSKQKEVQAPAVYRKLTAASAKQLQLDFSEQPGIPPLARRISRKKPELLQPREGDLWAGILTPYVRYKADWASICAILPAYLPDGTNGCIIHYIDGGYDILRNRLTWVLDDLLESMLTSKELLMRQSLRWMGGIHRRRVPLLVCDSFCLVPVTCKEVERRNDGSTGYVVLHHVKAVYSGAEWRSRHRDQEDLLSDYDNLLNPPQNGVEGNENTILIFRNGIAPYSERTAGKLAVRDSVRIVQNNIYLAYQLLYQVQHTCTDETQQ